MADGILELRGGLEPLVSVKLRGTDLGAIKAALIERISQAPGFFRNAPIVVDCSSLGEADAAALDLPELLVVLKGEGLHPVAARARSTDEALNERLRELGLAMLAPGRGRTLERARAEPVAPSASMSPKGLAGDEPPTEGAPAEQAAAAPVEDAPAAAGEPEPAEELDDEDEESLSGSAPALLVTRPVRSGQRHYAPHGDLVVIGQVGVGSELIAAGSIHVYGALRGRALCGAHGDASARIYCMRMEAELVSVAGTYRSLEKVPDNVAGKAATTWLDGDTLRIDPLS